jgi:hypothetical protein
VVPAPEPQRRLPSLKFTQTRPPLQSESAEQVSHSPPPEQAKAGRAVRITNKAHRTCFMVLIVPERAAKGAIAFI